MKISYFTFAKYKLALGKLDCDGNRCNGICQNMYNNENSVYIANLFSFHILHIEIFASLRVLLICNENIDAQL